MRVTHADDKKSFKISPDEAAFDEFEDYIEVKCTVEHVQSKKQQDFEKKTAAFMVFSVLTFIGLMIYIAVKVSG